MKRSPARSLCLTWSLCVLGMVLLLHPITTSSAAPAGMQNAWERVRQAGAYHFSADIVQTAMPLPTATNVGRQSRQEALHVEGQTTLLGASLDLTVWSRGGSLFRAEDGFQVRVADGRAMAREGAGAWEEIEDFTGLFAPQGDALAYLAAARDVVDEGTSTRAGLTFTRYTFQVDGRRFAAYVRDQLERRLAEQGELPPGVGLELPRLYVEMAGQGELWVGEDGLPLRQILRLQFPETEDDRVEAEVDVTFSQFGAGVVQTPPRSIFGRFSPERALKQGGVLAAALGLLALAASLRRSKKVTVALVLAVILSMVVTPLCQSGRAAAFAERQAARAREQDLRLQEAQWLREAANRLLTAEAARSAPGLDALTVSRAGDGGEGCGEGGVIPGAGPLVGAWGSAGPDPAQPGAAPEDGSDGDRDGLADDEEKLLGTNPSLVDSDGDGLTDYEEILLGTGPLAADSDGDLITDTLEVTGYVYTSTTATEVITATFYGDPLQADTNRDGIADWTEWHAAGDGRRPGDSDGDGVPDIIARDNDGDGVPDNLDLSPFQSSRHAPVFGAQQPFSLIVDGLEPGNPTYVEFQVRPTDPDHLWYAFNVLDWPEDRQGQVQDGDGLTYGDRDPGGPGINDNGDVKLVPMLEIVIPGEVDSLPPVSTLRKVYGVYVQDMATLGMGPGKMAYVPLQLVIDQVGGARVAFTGKMLYLPGESWAEAHQVRLVWIVQALLDTCAEDGWKDGQCNAYDPEKSNQPQIIQRYDDEWILTGLNVREDRGQEAGVIWEDPARDGDLHGDDALMRLSQLLDETFLAGRDCEALSAESRCVGDGQRDVTVSELSRRLGQTADPQARWSLPDVLSMETFSYTHQDEALLTLVLTDTRQILEANFTDRWSEASPITPTMLFLREEEFRASNLDALAAGEAFRWGGANGGELRVDMGAEGIQPITMASASWKPYRYAEGTGWENCSIAAYWEELESRYLEVLAEGGDPEAARSDLFLFQFYYATGYSGVSEIVQTGDLLPSDAGAVWRSPDAELAETILEEGGGAIKSIVANLDVNTLYLSSVFEELVSKKGLYSLPAKDMTPDTMRAIGEIDRLRLESGSGRARSNAIWARDAIPDQPLKAERKSGLGGAAIAGLGLTAVNLGLLVADQYTDSKEVEIAATVSTYTVGIVGLAMGAVELAQSAMLVNTMVKSGMSLTKALTASSEVAGASKFAAKIGLIVSIGITVVFFTIGLVQGLQAGANLVQIQMMLAQAIAQIIMAVLMFVLSATIIGNVIVGLIIIFDTIMSLVGLEEYTSAALLAKVLYGYSTIAQPDCALGASTRSFTGPGRGVVGGNTMVLTQTFTATAKMKDPDDWRAQPYLRNLWTRDLLWGSDVRCELDSQAQELSAGSTLWQRVVADHTYRGWSMLRAEFDTIDDVSVDLKPGINFTPAISLNMGYQVPVANCWWVGLLIPPICYPTFIDGNSATDLGALMPIDVLPAALDDFYWWDDLGTQQDHDGDGLRALIANGNDPDDTRPDADGDGLSDAYELERRSRGGQEGGARPSLLSDDTDGDGLSDGDEIRLGTFPNKRDSDGDGLRDSLEVYHYDLMTRAWTGGWEYRYTVPGTQGAGETRAIRVTSDPLAADTDGDGLNDGVERALGENPRAWTPNPQGLRAEIDDADGIVGPGQTVVYTATLENNIRMDPGYFITGTLTTRLPGPSGSEVLTRAYNIYQGESVSVVRAVIAAGEPGGGEVALTGQARGWIHDGNITDTYRLDAAALRESEPLPAPVHANIAASPGAGDLFAVASMEGRSAVNLRAVNQALPPPRDVRGDQGCGPGVRPYAPGIACADDGRCLTTWANVHYDHNCTDIHVVGVKAISQTDGSGEGNTGEYYLEVNGSHYPGSADFWSTTTWGLETGVFYGLDITQRFCGSAKLELLDHDSWSSADSLGTHSVDYCSAGRGRHEFGTGGGQGVVELWWVVDEQRKDGVYGSIAAAHGPASAAFAIGGPDWEVGRQRPAVAGDGTDFLVLWQEPGPSGLALYARQVIAAGDDGPVTLLDTLPGGADAGPAVAWAGGGRYVAVWQSAASNSIQMATLDGSGVPVDGSRQTVALQAKAAQVAANPRTGQALVVYVELCDTGRCLKGRLVDAWSEPGLAEALGPEIDIADRVRYDRAPAVAYEPRYGGWLVSWPETSNLLHTVPLGAGGEPLLAKEGRGPQATFQPIRGTVAIGESLLSQDMACSAETTDYAQCDLVASANDRLYLQPLFLELVPALVGPITTTAVTSLTVDADPPTSTVTSLVDGQRLAVSGTLVIGGDAADATSGVARVQVSVDGGPWQDAEGSESWVYGWQVPDSEGPVTLSTRASDLVGNTGPAETIAVTIDRTPPDVGLAAGDVTSATQQAGSWSVTLNGTANDRQGDVERVEVLVTPDGNGWQRAAVEGNTWHIDYALLSIGSDGSPLIAPSSTYTVQVRAADAAGNEAPPGAGRAMRVDALPPEVEVTYPTTRTAAITTAVSLSGVIADPGPVAAGPGSLAVSFTPPGGSPAGWLPAMLDRTGLEATVAGWSLPIPGNLEGMFQIDLRATDALGNSSDNPLGWQPWRGEIDTLAPRAAITATLRGAGRAAQTVYEGRAEDLNLSVDGFEFPCAIQAADATYYDDAWWIETTGDTRRLHRLAPACIAGGWPVGAPALEACDIHGHCTTASVAPRGEPAALASAVLSPAGETVLTTTNPISLAIGAFARNGLDVLTLTVNGVEEGSFAWAGQVSDTITSTTWTPPGEGHYTLVTEARDRAGNVQPDPQPITITVDTENPSVALSTTVLTTAHGLSFRRVALSGTAGDSVGLEEVAVSVDEGPWDAARLEGETWRYPWFLGPGEGEPDGETHVVLVRATDAAGRTAQVTEPVIVDLVPPSPLTVTLAYDVGDGPVPLEIGQTVRAVSATLSIGWTESGAGAYEYRAGWSTAMTPAVASLVPAVGGYELALAEPQALVAHVAAYDASGNSRVQTAGPVYLDGPSTPDLVADLGYHGWMESGCTQIGADREMARRAEAGATLTGTQTLHATWDREALRLAWTGADWNLSGDLFLYLDTRPGVGAATAYDPYGQGPEIRLPGEMAADYLLWVEDEAAVALLAGSADGGWTPANGAPGGIQVALDAGRARTDVLIPFDLVGIDPGGAGEVSLVALASEEDALRLWAAMPGHNPLNSVLAVNPVATDGLARNFALTQRYRWTSLGDGQCPNLGQFATADLRVSLGAEPPGLEAGFLEHDLPGLLIPGLPLDGGDMDGEPDVSLPVDDGSVLLGDGQTVTYTLSYAHLGAEVAAGAVVTLTARGALELSGGSPSMTLPLDAMSGTVHVTGTVNAGLDGQSAELDAVVADAVHGAFDWLWVQHGVDSEPPAGLRLVTPAVYVGPGLNQASGSVSDPSGVPTITLEVYGVEPAQLASLTITPSAALTADLGAQASQTITCTDATPLDGTWACTWDTGGAADGTQIGLRARATDRFGASGDWTAPLTVTVDATPPAVRLHPETETALRQDALLGPDDLWFSGQVEDDRQAAGVQVCVTGPGENVPRCALFDATPEEIPQIADWYARAPIAADSDSVPLTLAFTGYDGVGNRTPEPVMATVRVDVVPPAGEAALVADRAVEGARRTVLAGTVRDGSGVERLQAYVAGPGLEVAWYGQDDDELRFDGRAWQLDVRFDEPGVYSLGVEAWDLAGNVRRWGPFHVEVVPPASDLSLALSALPASATARLPLDYTVRVTNAGPQPASTAVLTLTLPAGGRLLQPARGCARDGDSLVCALGDLAPGQGSSIGVRWQAPMEITRTLVCHGTVASGTPDPDPANNRRTLRTPVRPYVPDGTLVCDGPDLLANGNFEGGFRDNGVARSWTAFNNGRGAEYGYRDDRWGPVVSEGRHSQLIVVDTIDMRGPAACDRTAGIYQAVRLLPGVTYELSVDAVVRERGAYPLEDPYRYVVGWGTSRGGTDPAAMDRWGWLPLRTIYPMSGPGDLLTHRTRFQAAGEEVTIWLYATKKWATMERELNVNLDNASLRLCRPAPTRDALPRQ